MKKNILFFCFLITLKAFSQNDTSVVVDISKDMNKKSSQEKEEKPGMKVFYSQRLINANTVEVLRKGMLDFNVTHFFSDVASKDGGIQQFFGLDNAFDIKIGFVLGLGDRLNLGLSRSKGNTILQLWELNLKYQILRQMPDDPKNPVSLTVFANSVISTQKANPVADREASFRGFSDRASNVAQVMLARKFGKISLQVSPTFLHTNYVRSIDQKNIFAIGGATRIPLTKKFIFVMDYFHSFRKKESRQLYRAQGVEFYDAMGVGVEILTQGHMFHLNFTNTGSILENRFIANTRHSWGKGQFRWGFTISRSFVLFRPKRR